MNIGVLIEPPNLDDELEQERVARAVLRMIGDNLSIEDAQFGQSVFAEIERILNDGEEIPDALLPVISTMYPGDPQYVLTVELSRLPSQMIKRLNMVPAKMRVAFLNLLNTTIIPALSATTTIRFKKQAAWLNIQITIPAGTVIADRTSQIRVATDEELIIPAGTAEASVNATSVVGGNIGRIKAGTIGFLQSAIAGLIEISNTSDLAGGRDAETTGQAIIRARESLRIGRHLGAADDYVVYVFTTVLLGLGRVTPFEFFRSDFTLSGPGHLTLAVQGEDGLPPTDALMTQIAEVINERHVASIYVYAVPALYKTFDIEAEVRLKAGPLAEVTRMQAIKNLQAAFAPLSFRYGPDVGQRYIELSDVAGAIEQAGKDVISINNSGNVFPITIILAGNDRRKEDVRLADGELPLLGSINLIPTFV